MFGGMPPRLLRLSRRGAELVAAFETGPVADDESARLARRLTDDGIAIPRPGPSGAPMDVTVVVPVRDRPRELADCLAAIGRRHRVVVVDDGSRDPDAVTATCRAHGADVVRRTSPGGPAAARNAGLGTVTSELVAFCDSDCLPGPGWIEALAGHFVDPLVVGVAPRIVTASPARGPSLVDQGTRPARVRPSGALTFVPAAAVVFRRAALGDGYDERLRYGEDVDLVWRLVEAGWRIRYAPDVEVRHRDPTTIAARVRRRFLYGTSAGPLERAHPGTIDHLVVGLGPACTVGSLLVGSPGLAVLAWGITTAHLERRLRCLAVGKRFALRLSVAQVFHAWFGLGRWCTTFGVPLLTGSLLVRRTRAGRRALRSSSLLVLSALLARRLGFGSNGAPPRRMADDFLGELAYGAGVVAGCARAGMPRPLLPRIGSASSRSSRRTEKGRPPLPGRGLGA